MQRNIVIGLKRFCFSLLAIAAVSVASPSAFAQISLPADHDTHIGYDGASGGTVGGNFNSSGALNIRNVNDDPTFRKRIGIISWDISTDFTAASNVQISLRMFDGNSNGDTFNIYGVLEDFDVIDQSTVTWNTAPGTINDSAPSTALSAALDASELTGILTTLVGVADEERALSVVTTAMDDFVNADTDGIVTFLIVPDDSNDPGLIRRSEGGPEEAPLLVAVTAGPTPTPTPTPTPQAVDLEGHWPLDDGPGSATAEDIVGNLDGTLTDYASLTTPWLPRAVSLTSGSLRFDGVDDHVIIPHGADIDFAEGESFSVSFLLRQAASFPAGDPVNENRYFTKGTYAADTGIRFEAYNKTGNFVFSMDDGTAKAEIVTPDTPFVTGDWVHVVCVRDEATSTILVYADGQQIATNGDNIGSVANSDPLVLGTSLATDRPDSIGFFEGDLDDVRIYRTALNATDIAIIAEQYEALIVNRARAWFLLE